MQLINELKAQEFKYAGSRKDYVVHDPRPNILVLDKNYKSDSILGYNLNYYSGDKDALRDTVNDLLKQEVKFYHTKKKLKRYQALKEQFPFMSNFIRRYKKDAIQWI